MKNNLLEIRQYDSKASECFAMEVCISVFNRDEGGFLVGLDGLVKTADVVVHI